MTTIPTFDADDDQLTEYRATFDDPECNSCEGRKFEDDSTGPYYQLPTRVAGRLYIETHCADCAEDGEFVLHDDTLYWYDHEEHCWVDVEKAYTVNYPGGDTSGGGGWGEPTHVVLFVHPNSRMPTNYGTARARDPENPAPPELVLQARQTDPHQAGRAIRPEEVAEALDRAVVYPVDDALVDNRRVSD